MLCLKPDTHDDAGVVVPISATDVVLGAPDAVGAFAVVVAAAADAVGGAGQLGQGRGGRRAPRPARCAVDLFRPGGGGRGP